MRIKGILLASALSVQASLGWAQDAQSLADVRQDLSVLYVEIQKLKTELSTTGSPSANVQGSSLLDRVTAIESELTRLTAQTEQLENRINRVVTDGTNRIGDLEFRLVELEGGDVSQLGETSTLGGETSTPAVAPAVEAPEGAELALGEKADFEAAQALFEQGDFRGAADKFGQFSKSYPGSPLGAQAGLGHGRSLNSLGDTKEAARAFLNAFTLSPTGPVAPEALYELGAALGALGQTQQGCVTLSEVAVRFPDAPAVAKAQAEMAKLSCS